MFQLANAAGTPTSSFTINNVGGTVDVRVYLLEFGSPGNVLSTEELFGASVRLTFDSPAGIAAVLSTGDILPIPEFVDLIPAPSVTASEAGFTGDVGFDPFLDPDINNRILLGTFMFTGLSPGTVSITALDRDPGTDDTVTGFGTVLDPDILDGNGTITVLGPTGAVPEPATLTLATLGIAGLLGFWRVRRKNPLCLS